MKNKLFIMILLTFAINAQEPEICTKDTDCERDFYCDDDGSCRKKCSRHTKCPPGYYCDIDSNDPRKNKGSRKCLPITTKEVGHECFKDSDCPGEFTKCIINYGDKLNFCTD